MNKKIGIIPVQATVATMQAVVKTFLQRRDRVANEYGKQSAAVSALVKTKPNDPKVKQMVSLLDKVGKNIVKRESEIKGLLAAKNAADKIKNQTNVLMQKGSNALNSALSFIKSKIGALPAIPALAWVGVGGLSLVALTAFYFWVRDKGNISVSTDISDLELLSKLRASLPADEQKQMDKELTKLVTQAAQDAKNQAESTSVAGAVSSGFSAIAIVGVIFLIMSNKK